MFKAELSPKRYLLALISQDEEVCVLGVGGVGGTIPNA